MLALFLLALNLYYWLHWNLLFAAIDENDKILL